MASLIRRRNTSEESDITTTSYYSGWVAVLIASSISASNPSRLCNRQKRTKARSLFCGKASIFRVRARQSMCVQFSFRNLPGGGWARRVLGGWLRRFFRTRQMTSLPRPDPCHQAGNTAKLEEKADSLTLCISSTATSRIPVPVKSSNTLL